MFYQKNLYSGESISRIVIGLAIAAASYFLAPSALIVGVAVALGAMLAMTGVVGWCPMCAMVGRKINNPG